MLLSRVLQHTGALVKYEVPIPEFNRQSLALLAYDHDDLHSADANMDVVAYHLPTGEEYLVDASIRPSAIR